MIHFLINRVFQRISRIKKSTKVFKKITTLCAFSLLTPACYNVTLHSKASLISQKEFPEKKGIHYAPFDSNMKSIAKLKSFKISESALIGYRTNSTQVSNFPLDAIAGVREKKNSPDAALLGGVAFLGGALLVGGFIMLLFATGDAIESLGQRGVDSSPYK